MKPLLLFLLVFSTLYCNAFNEGRSILQNRDTTTIDSSNANSFASLLEEASPNTAFDIEAEEVTIDSVISVTSNNLIIRGANSDPTVLRCLEGGKIEIAADGVELSNLVIQDCQATAINLINDEAVYDPFSSTTDSNFDLFTTQFDTVTFQNNKAAPDEDLDPAGGALNLGPGTKAVIKKCEFKGNEAKTGGAILVDGSASLEVTRTKFDDNIATIAGGAIAAGFSPNFFPEREFTISIEKSDFRRNKDTDGGEDVIGLTLPNGAPLENSVFLKFPTPDPSGGAIFVEGYSSVEISECNFLSNTAVPAGGAMYISDNVRIHVTDCEFSGNSVTSESPSPATTKNLDLELGGAVYLVFTEDSSYVKFTRCTFEKNKAAYGGALHVVTSLAASVLFDSVQIDDNFANLGGGGLFIRNTIQATFSNVRFNRNVATAGGGAMLTNGAGGIFVTGPSVGDTDENGEFVEFFLDVYVTENQAVDGAGMFLLGSGEVIFQKVHFVQNKARRNGGGLGLISSLPSGTITIQDCHFHSNAARRGGGVFVDNVAELFMYLVTQRNEFIQNVAMAGGAMLISPTSQVRNNFQLGQAVYERNRAVTTPEEAGITGLDLPDVNVESSGFFRRLATLSRTLAQQQRGTTQKLIDPNLPDGCNPGGGGAICLLATGVPERAPATVNVSDICMFANSASVGGAIFVAISSETGWEDRCIATDTASESLTERPCKTIQMENVNIRLNKASAAGGGVFISDPTVIRIDLEGDGSLINLADVPQDNNRLTGNTVDNGGFGPQIATNVASMKILEPKLVSEDQLLFENHNSGVEFNITIIELRDHFGQRVTGGIVDSEMAISVQSQIVSGETVAKGAKGLVNFTKVTPLGLAYEFEIAFIPASRRTERIDSRFSIRQCIVGETRVREQKVCAACDEEYFGFNFSYPCSPCPDNAECRGSAALVPINGYWHSTPFSPIMHECILEEACSYKGRRGKLEAYFEYPQSLIPSNQSLSQEEYPMCAPEYTGPLCGSCIDGYGHVIDGECFKCEQEWLTAVLIAVVCLWTLFLLFSTGQAAFETIRDLRDMRNFRVLTMSKNAETHSRSGSQVPIRQTERGNRVRFAESSGGDSRESIGNYKSSAQDNTLVEDDTVNPKGNQKFTSLTGDENVDLIVASEKVSETIKILTNFFQITSIGVGINSTWTQAVSLLLVVEESVSSVSSGASFAPMECLMKNVDDRTVIGVVLRAVFPLFLMVVYIFLTVTYHRKKDTAFKAKRRVVIGLLVGLFFAYDTVTEMLMRLVNCIELDSKHIKDNIASNPVIIQYYGQYANANETYWAEDTRHVCWKGSHGLAAGILGVPGLIIVTFGMPLALTLFLIYKRQIGVVLEPECLNMYGFVYQSYRGKFVYWEAIIMLRKACMAAVIVFAYDLGPNLQAAIALGILIFALLAQFLASPYKFVSLNVLESLSLLASIFIFYSGIVFRDVNTSYAGKVILSIIIIATNIAMVALFLHRLIAEYDNLVIVKLRVEKVDIPDNALQRLRLLVTLNILKNYNSIKDKVLGILGKTPKQVSIPTTGGSTDSSPTTRQG